MNGAPALAAALPILAILGLMLGLGWSAARAGLAGCALALVLAVTVFDFGADGSLPRHLLGVGAEGAFIATTILWILWPALALHAQQQAAGATEVLRAALVRLHPDPRVQALCVAWFLALFFEGAAGFGTPVALAAPLLVSLGVPPLRAVVLALIGHAIGVCFGALGTPVAAQLALADLDGAALAAHTALLALPCAAVLMVFLVRTLAGIAPAANASARSEGTQAPAAAMRPVAVAAWLAWVVPMLGLALWVGPELPTLGGALLGAALFAPWIARRARALPAPCVAPGAHPPLRRALAPYLVLVGVILATRAPTPVRELLDAIEIRWQSGDGYGARMQPLLHPGTLLWVALLAGASMQRRPLASLAAVLTAAARRLRSAAVALVAMLCLSRLMLHAGMIDVLQQAAVQWLGPAWPLLAPALGALGSFVTGSATASNVLFTALQVQAAQALGHAPAWIAAGQGVGAAIGNIVCPHNLVAGAATVGLGGREFLILRRTLAPAVVVVALCGLLLAARVAG